MKAKEGKYLTFSLKNEHYGIPIGTVKEIIAMLPITAVPKTQKFIKGVINLRGSIIPIMDLRLKLELEEIDYSERTCIIVVNIENEKTKKQMGIAVDTVSEVMDIKESDIEEFLKHDIHVSGDFIVGMGKIKDKVIMLLDVMKVLDKSELNKMIEIKEQAEAV